MTKDDIRTPGDCARYVAANRAMDERERGVVLGVLASALDAGLMTVEDVQALCGMTHEEMDARLTALQVDMWLMSGGEA